MKRVYTIRVFGQQFSIRTDAQESRIEELVGYLENKFETVTSETKNISLSDQMALTLLDVANDYFEMRDLNHEMMTHVERKSDKIISRIESIATIEI